MSWWKPNFCNPTLYSLDDGHSVAQHGSFQFRSVSFSVYTSFVRFCEMEETISCTQARNIRLNDFTPSFKLWIFLDYLHCLVVRCTIILFIAQWKRIFSSTSSALTLWIVFCVINVLFLWFGCRGNKKLMQKNIHEKRLETSI